MSTELKELAVELFLDPKTAATGTGFTSADLSEYEPSEPAFSSYCVKARDLVRAGKVNADDVEIVYHDLDRLDGPNREYVLDLLRRVSEELNDPDLSVELTKGHLRLLIDRTYALHKGDAPDVESIRKARRVAERALRILDGKTVSVDPDLRADVHLAYGSTFARPVDTYLAIALEHYVIALRLKREAGDVHEVARLEVLLMKMIDHACEEELRTRLMGGQGMAIHDLRAAYEAAQVLGREHLVIRLGLALAEAYRSVAQSTLAEPLFRSLLYGFELQPESRLAAEVGLAQALSEQFRFPEALEILESRYAAGMTDEAGLVCLGNCRRETGDIAGARDVLQHALDGLPEPEENEVSLRRIQLRMLLGELACLAGSESEGLNTIRETLDTAKHAPPILGENLHRYQMAARCFLKAGRREEARTCVDRAIRFRHWYLENKPTPAVLESILGGFRELDFYDVELALADDGQGPAYALLSAEAAKGRLLRWSEHLFDPESVKRARILDRREDQLKRVQAWLDSQVRPARALSLFATTRGLAVFSLRPNAGVEARWVTPFDYPMLAKRVFEPWEALLPRAHEGTSGLWDAANIATEYLLTLTGDLLWRAFPDLLQGGERLIVMPHRMFRSIPFAGVVLPGGKRLGDLYPEMTVLPSLAMFSQAIERQQRPAPLAYDRGVRALVDPDGSLPFALLEALTLGADARILIGEEVTTDMVRETFLGGHQAAIHLSCHGAFDEGNAWRSALRVANGELRLSDLLLEGAPRADLVLLGACEAGKSQRSPSDEPIGFAELMAQSGVGAVISPVWDVDDFASLLFIVEFHRRREQGVAIAVGSASRWLRDLTALDARDWLRTLRTDLAAKIQLLPAEQVKFITPRLDAIEGWLSGLSIRDRPFVGPLDWAGFQMTGLFPLTPENAN